MQIREKGSEEGKDVRAANVNRKAEGGLIEKVKVKPGKRACQLGGSRLKSPELGGFLACLRKSSWVRTHSKRRKLMMMTHEGGSHEGRCMWLVRPLALDDRLDVTCESKREAQDASKDLAQANEMMELLFTEMMGHIYNIILTSKKRLNLTWSVTISSG